MKVGFKHWLMLIICLFGGVTTINLSAQSPEKFGWSLRKFENDKDAKPKNRKINNRRQPSPEMLVNSQVTNDGIEKTTGEEIVRVETNLAVNNVLVVDDHNRVVKNLQPTDFIVTEDGVEQQVDVLAFEENAALPRSIVLIFYNGDVFYSAQSNYIGALTLIDKLAPQDKMAIVTPDLKLKQDFTNDKDLLKNKITDIATHPIRPLAVDQDFGTLLAVLNEIFTHKDKRPIVIFQEVGEEIWGMKTDQDFQPPQDRIDYWVKYQKKRRGYGFDDVREAIERSRVTIYSIIPQLRLVGLSKQEQLKRTRLIIKDWYLLNNPDATPAQVVKAQDDYQEPSLFDYLTAQTKIKEITELGGGFTDFLETPEQGEKIYSAIFTDLSNRYTLGYYSTNQAQDGKLRQVKIRVRGHPEYTLLYRKSYLPPKGNE